MVMAIKNKLCQTNKQTHFLFLQRQLFFKHKKTNGLGLRTEIQFLMIPVPNQNSSAAFEKHKYFSKRDVLVPN